MDHKPMAHRTVLISCELVLNGDKVVISVINVTTLAFERSMICTALWYGARMSLTEISINIAAPPIPHTSPAT